MVEAGIGIADITPEIGMTTSIFINLKITKIVTPLKVKACLLRSGTDMAAIISMDTTSLYSCSIGDVRNAVSKATGLTENRILVNSTHTHSSPYLNRAAQDYLERLELRFLDRGYYEQILLSVEQAARDALARLTPVRVKFSKGTVREVACNRRVPLPDGTIGARYSRNVPELRAYPEGLIDPEVLCAWLVDERGRMIGSLVNYACHATAYNQYSEICWDYPGFAAEQVERELGGTCLFLQGCAGNVSPGKYTVGEPLEDYSRMGRHVADAIIAGYASAKTLAADDLLVANEYVSTGLRILRGKAELERMLEAEIAKYNEAKDSPGPYRSTNIFSITQRIQLLDRYPELQMPSEVAVVKLGQLSLVFLPGEAFIQSALKLKAKFPQAKLMVMAYTDVSLEYVPIEEAFSERGGYETCEEWCFSVPGNAELLEGKAADMLQRYS